MIEFLLNGKKVMSGAHPLTRCIDVIRDDLSVTSVKEGCGEGECGACSILLNGRLANSCILPLAQVDGAEIVTVEGIKETQGGRVIIDAFVQEGAVQCGFCIPGMVVATYALLQRMPEPNEQEIRSAISGNLCRCTGYDLIIAAIRKASDEGKGLW